MTWENVLFLIDLTNAKSRPRKVYFSGVWVTSMLVVSFILHTNDLIAYEGNI